MALTRTGIAIPQADQVPTEHILLAQGENPAMKYLRNKLEVSGYAV
jgi:hypothetical protein